MSIAEISELVGLIATGLGLVAMVVAYVKKIVSDIKTKKLHAFIEEKMIEAENKDISGTMKLAYVLNELCGEYGGDYKKIETKAKEYIEECIYFSKQINNHKK